eukprot:1141511-Pelagomonas_calceolata.AAC.5
MLFVLKLHCSCRGTFHGRRTNFLSAQCSTPFNTSSKAGSLSQTTMIKLLSTLNNEVSVLLVTLPIPVDPYFSSLGGGDKRCLSQGYTLLLNWCGDVGIVFHSPRSVPPHLLTPCIMQQARHLTEDQHSYPSRTAPSTERKPAAHARLKLNTEDTRPGQHLEEVQRQHADLCKNMSGKGVTLHAIFLSVGETCYDQIKNRPLSSINSQACA